MDHIESWWFLVSGCAGSRVLVSHAPHPHPHPRCAQKTGKHVNGSLGQVWGNCSYLVKVTSCSCHFASQQFSSLGITELFIRGKENLFHVLIKKEIKEA